MPRAVILTTASKNNATGGTFVDSLAANSGDSLGIANFTAGGARIIEAWGIDSDHTAELQLIYSRGHDQLHGVRFGLPALTPGGAGTVAAVDLLPGYMTLPVYSGDTATIQATCTAADDLIFSYLIEYDDMPGVDARFASWAQVQAMSRSLVGIQVTAVASATEGTYGTARAFNADDDRLHADTYYALLGATVRTPVTTITLISPDWGGQRIGLPAGVSHLNPGSWFVDQSIKWNKPLIPIIAANNKTNILVQVCDGEASTSPAIDFLLAELTGRP